MLLRHETYEHSYPHCWRCRKPLIYRAVSSWFVQVTEFRDRMVEVQFGRNGDPQYELNSIAHKRQLPFGEYVDMVRSSGASDQPSPAM